MQEYAYNQRHMGTDVIVTFVTESEITARHIADEVFLSIKNAEQTFSRFIPDNELSRLNAAGTLVVSEIFMKVLEKAVAIHHQTSGVFNPLIQVAQQGYTENYADIIGTTKTASTTPYNLTISDLTYDTTTREVHLAPTQQLDFGGMLKGFLAEVLAKSVIQSYPTCTGTIINIGGDIHTRGLDEHGQPFTFFITNPITHAQTPLTIKNTSLVTSGTYKRHWKTTLGPRHHIIGSDGITNPASPVVSASVLYEDGAVAEAFAKYVLIINPTHIDTTLLPTGLQYYLVLKDGSTSSHLS